MALFLILYKITLRIVLHQFLSSSKTLALLIVQDNFDKLNVYFGKLLDDFFTYRTLVLTIFFCKKNPKIINIINFAMALFSICKKLLWS